MLTCPMCKKGIPDLVPTCPRCRTDLSLLTDHVTHLDVGLARADALTRQGDLAEAVWTYLEVLEVDPDNPTARRQVGRVATAVRQFDRAQPGRRWLDRLRRQARFRRWLQSWEEKRRPVTWSGVLAVVLLAAAAFALGYAVGQRSSTDPIPPAAVPLSWSIEVDPSSPNLPLIHF